MNLGTLLWVSVQPVIKVILLCGVGVVCVRKGILDYAGRKTISTLAYLVFAPCLNYSALSLSVTPERLELWWPLIVNVLMTHLLGAALGLLNVWLVPGHPRRFRRHIIACSMFGNNGNLPLVIVTSLARVASQVLGGIDPNEAEALAVSYVMIGIIVSLLFVPTIGFHLTSAPPEDRSSLREHNGAAVSLMVGADDGGGGGGSAGILPVAAAGAEAAAAAAPGDAAKQRLGPSRTNCNADGASSGGRRGGGGERAWLLGAPSPMATSGKGPCAGAGREGGAHARLLGAPSPTATSGRGTRAGEGREGGEDTWMLGVPPLHPPVHSADGAAAGGGPSRGGEGRERVGRGEGREGGEEREGGEGGEGAGGVLPHQQHQHQHQQHLDGPNTLPQPSRGSEVELAWSREAAPNDAHDHNRTYGLDPEGATLLGTGRPRCTGGVGGGGAAGTGGAEGGFGAGALGMPMGAGQSGSVGSDGDPEGQRAGGGVAVAGAPDGRWGHPQQPGDATAALSSTAAAATAASSSTPPAARLRLSRFAPEFVSMGQLPSGARMAALREGIELPEGDEPSGAGGRGTPHDSDHRGDGASHSHHDDDHGGDHDDLTPLVGSSESQTLSSFSGHDRAADMGALLPRLLLPRAGRARREARAAWTLLRDLAVNPNVMTSVLAIIVGCSPPLRAALIGDDAPLALFQSAIAMLGACCIPSIMIGLGATLAHGPGGGDLPLVTLLSSSVIRLMILPALGMVTVLGGYTAGLYYAPDAVFLLVMLIQNTVPTAIMVHTMSTVNGCCEAEVSTLLFWQYLACIVTIPPYLALYLWALSRAYEPAAPIA